MTAQKFNDRIINEGFPEGWYIQDRLDEGEALLCKRTDLWPGNTCVCLKPRAITTDKWAATAIQIAKGFDEIDALQAQVMALQEVLNEIRELNMTGEDENGNRWANSDLIEQAIVFANKAVWPGPGEKPHAYSPDPMLMGDCKVCGQTREAHEKGGAR